VRHAVGRIEARRVADAGALDEGRKLGLFEDIDSDGAGYIAIFAGQSTEVRARDYYDAIERGALDTRIADAQVVTPMRVISFSQKGH